MDQNTQKARNTLKDGILFLILATVIATPVIFGVSTFGSIVSSILSFILIAAAVILLFPFIGYPLLLAVSLPAQLLVWMKKRKEPVKAPVLSIVSE